MKIDRYIMFSTIAAVIGIAFAWGTHRLYLIVFLGFLLGYIYIRLNQKNKKEKQNKKEQLLYVSLVFLFFFGGYNYACSNLKSLDSFSESGSQTLIFRVEESKGKRYIGQILNNEMRSSSLKKIIFYTTEELNTGEIYQGIFTSEALKIARIPFGFNEKKYYLGNNIYCKGKLLNIIHNQEKTDFYGKFLQLREKMLLENESHYTGKSRGFIRAVIFGDRSLFEEDVEESFKLLGLSHLLAVSGLHAGIIAFIFYRLCSPGGFLFKNIIVSLVLLFYAFLSGFSPSISRAAMMFFLASFGRINLRYIDSYTIIATSALIQIINNPFVILSISFQLSYLTLIVIIFFSRREKEKACYTAAVATLGAAPFIIYYFNKISLIGILINVFYIPVFSCVTFAAFLGLCGSIFYNSFFDVFYRFFDFILNNLLEITVTLAGKFEFMDFCISSPSIWEGVLYYFLITLIFFRRKLANEYILTGIMILLLINQTSKVWEISFLDVGQGDSIYINTYNEKIIVVDGGPWGKDLEGLLSSKGINRPELYVLSHPDSDHINGLIWMMKKKPSKNLLLPINCSNELMDEIIGIASKTGTKVIFASAGQRFSLDGTDFKIVSPEKDRQFSKTNNQSIVMQVEYNKKTILLTGDIEKKILDGIYLEKEIDLLKAPHHGSNTGISSLFFDRNTVLETVISVGENNRYKHPGNEFLKLLDEYGVRYFRTDKSGTITYFLEKEGNFKSKVTLD